MSRVDGRGSEKQRLIYSMVKEIYPTYEVVYEFSLPNGKRYDIFIPALGIAIELDGAQHRRYIEFFHRDINGYINQIRGDVNKDEYSEENGIKLIRIQDNDMIESSAELKNLIDKTPYPEVPYNLFFANESKSKGQFEIEMKQRRREYNKKKYQEYKQRIKDGRKDNNSSPSRHDK